MASARMRNAARAASIMDMVDLPARFADRYPKEISGGQRLRVAIARALVMNPDLIVCDKPTSALDVSVQSQILNLMMDLKRELGPTYVFILGNLSVVEHLVDQVAAMYLGRVVELGGAAQVFAAPRHPYTRALLDSALTVAPGQGLPDIGLGAAFPNPLAIPPGCPFQPRCPRAFDLCSQVRPHPADVAFGAAARHLAEDPLKGAA